MEETQPKPASNPSARILSAIWIISGILLLISPLLPLYSVANESFNLYDLIRMLNKDMAEIMRYIGEFTTFMMYFSVLFGMFMGAWLLVKGIVSIARGRTGAWVTTLILTGIAVLLFFLTMGQMDHASPDNPLLGMIISDKLMPKPAFGFYLATYISAGAGIATLVIGLFTGKR